MKTRTPATLLFFVALLTGCTQKIDLDLNDENTKKLVVEGWVTDEQKPHRVLLTETASYFSNEAVPRATGAEVSISDGETITPLMESSPGVYETPADFQGQIGKTYRLSILHENQIYEAASVLDTVPEIDSLRYEFVEGEEDEDPYYELYLFTQELPGEGDHYMWLTYVNGVNQTDTLANVTFVTDDLVDGNYIFDWYFTDVEAEVGDTILVQMYSISPELYDMFIAVMLETEWRGGIFDTPRANVPSNVSNGALGFFAAAAVVEKTIVIQE